MLPQLGELSEQGRLCAEIAWRLVGLAPERIQPQTAAPCSERERPCFERANVSTRSLSSRAEGATHLKTTIEQRRAAASREMQREVQSYADRLFCSQASSRQTDVALTTPRGSCALARLCAALWRSERLPERLSDLRGHG